jgi:hypothetical protein
MLNTAATTCLSEANIKKFKLSSPAEISSVYKRVITSGVPSSKRFEDDVEKVSGRNCESQGEDGSWSRQL